MVSGVAGDTLEFSFDGTAVCVLGMKDKSGGRIRVELDGMCVERDTWYECPLYRESLFTACGLASERTAYHDGHRRAMHERYRYAGSLQCRRSLWWGGLL